ncbi:hypothetical protein PR202_ga15653 [Eleusine coracana subsp. coracana]|uniref:Alpha/beta hydrolase fold-3 domain-containing protein n=1 Tax=Eleusine coracana subsp. coracana TaxID=191504 RepID=A0AAV5CK80_ELECO|nr:hypothetical protein PR202_ga15653 [Eleusine coracana subsp. coracana]
MDPSSKEIVFEVADFKVYKDGQVERASSALDTVPAGFDADTGVTSRDVVIDAATGVAARLYLPTINAMTNKLPVVVFFHGGYFIVGSPWHPNYHHYVNSLAAGASVVAVSVDYRLAPEHLLPAAALNWVASGADTWLSDHGDLGRIFVVGVSAGANIAHNVAMAAGVIGLQASMAPTCIKGVVLLHPSFAAEEKMEAENKEFLRANRVRWEVIFPDAKGGLDDPRINPMAAAAPSLAKLPGERLLVCTASGDPRASRGRAYRDALQASGWRGKVQWFESENEGHCFFVPNHGGREAVKLMDRVVRFLAGL